MAAREILKYPDPRLRQACAPVTAFDEPLRQLAADLSATLLKRRGAGLTANQVGEPVSLFVVDAGFAGRPRDSAPVAFVNAAVTVVPGEEVNDDEGCLSFPGVFVTIRRSLRARVRSQDLSGNPIELEAEGVLARILQHEADHLAGRLLVDVVGPVTRKIILAKLRKLDKTR